MTIPNQLFLSRLGRHERQTLKAFDVVYPELEREDPKSAVEALGLGMNLEIVSAQTATGLAPWPLDYQQEQKRLDVEREKQMKDIAQGLRAPLLPFGAPSSQNGSDNERTEDDQTEDRSEARRDVSGVQS